MNKHSNSAHAIFTLLVVLLVSESSFAQPMYLSGVPDWDQPVKVSVSPPSPGGAWGAWCVPAAMANIAGYYNDKGIANTGDDMLYPTAGPWPVDPRWQDETADASGGPRGDLGWFFNTNDLGLGGSILIPPTYRGTKIQHIRDGVTGNGGLLGGGSGYFPLRGQNYIDVQSLGSYRMDPAIYVLFDTYDPTHTQQPFHDDMFGFSEIMLSISASQPVLAHFDHFNLQGSVRLNDPFIGDYDKAEWGNAPSYPTAADENSGEIWDPGNGLGHTVTVVGTWDPFDPSNPFPGQFAIIVYDNMDGSLPTAAKDPLPLVLLWPGSPWAGLTIIHHGIQWPTVTAPNGGEAIIADSDSVITWDNFGSIADVSIEYTTDNGSNWSDVSPANVGNSGSYLWRTPVVDSDQCKVKITSAISSSLFDFSDDLFTIYECILSYDLDGDCAVGLTDLALLASEWQGCGNQFGTGCGP